MPTKFQLITELYDQTVQSVTGSYQSWTGFLRAACYNYKCPFDDQILIYAQRPDATAVLEMERWNRQFGRWVNRGAKSIAVFGDDGQNCLKLYFDVSDTHASRFARPLPIWTMHPAFEPEVIETLEATFGNLAEKENLADAVRSACHNAVADNFTDYLQDLRECREDSLLEELDDLNLEAFYRNALEVSVAYMLLTRLGLRADDYFSPDEFAHVYEFNTTPTINALGIAASDIAEMGLREISRTVMQAQRDQFFANREKRRYDDHTERHEAGRERSKQYGGHLQDAERLSGAEPADAADAGGASGQVRGAAERVPEKAPQSALHQPENQRQADGASGRDRADRAEDGGADRGADGESRGRDGGTESDRSAALDGPDEQPQAQRGGAGAERPDLRLTTEEPTEAGSDELPAFVDHSRDYVLLDRLRADCDYFLGAGGRSEKHLWAGSVYAQIKKMQELYDALPEKPEWLTAEAIDRYATQMAAPYAEGVNEKYLPADEYLSGNVRQKLAVAQGKAEQDPQYQINADALAQVQPTDLTASEISVRLGATWLDTEYVRRFIFETLGTPRSVQWGMKVHYSGITGEWRIEGKSKDRGNVKAISTYGTKRINAYEIIEDTLNLKDVRIFDYVYDADGRKTAVLNKKETAIAQSKQELIKDAFAEWIWKDPDRREAICKTYNILFNSNRPREYDGSHISFSGMNPEITLRKHQVNAIAHILYGGNTLLAHVVGAGKTFEMVAAAMESKRLGLCQKSLFVVPNHLTEQWATEFLQLYPAANILVATRKDFETKNRKKFCGRIATGDYDAIIIGHSQFEKIPMSVDRQRAILEQQIDEIMMGISEAKREKAENFTIKQMEKTKKGLQAKIDKLNDQSRKDDVVTFEELGVDRIFIDESHYFKNLFLYTKMRNVGGIAQTEAQKSSDLFMKCRYLDEITGGRGIVFATGTPISNSMVELYTIQRYLQMSALEEQGLQHFDSWAANYGETVTAIELSPEGYTLVGR